MAAIAALLGDGSKQLTPRVVFAYFLSGSLTSAGLVMLLSEQFGFHYFLMAVGVFAAFKAVDIIAAVSVAIGDLVRYLLLRKKDK